MIPTGDPEDLNITDEFDGVGRKFTSSYLEEKAALEHALRWLVSHDDDFPASLSSAQTRKVCASLSSETISSHLARSSRLWQN